MHTYIIIAQRSILKALCDSESSEDESKPNSIQTSPIGEESITKTKYYRKTKPKHSENDIPLKKVMYS